MLIKTIEDLATLTDSELSELFLACIKEDARRKAAQNYLEETMPTEPSDPGEPSEPSEPGEETLVVEEISEYVQPTGAHDAYALGAKVVFDGWVYQSLIPANVWTPVDYPRGWHKLNKYSEPVIDEPEEEPTEPDEPVDDPEEPVDPVEPDPTDDEPTEPEPTPEAPEWVQPTGAHDAYMYGDQVMFEAHLYESTIDNNVWSPVDYPAGWRKIEQ